MEIKVHSLRYGCEQQKNEGAKIFREQFRISKDTLNDIL